MSEAKRTVKSRGVKTLTFSSLSETKKINEPIFEKGAIVGHIEKMMPLREIEIIMLTELSQFAANTQKDMTKVIKALDLHSMIENLDGEDKIDVTEEDINMLRGAFESIPDKRPQAWLTHGKNMIRQLVG